MQTSVPWRRLLPMSRLLTTIHAELKADAQSLDSLAKLREFARKQGWRIMCQYLDELGAKGGQTRVSADAVIGLVTAMAIQEHARISRSVKAGISRAKATGKPWGPPAFDLNMKLVRKRRAAGESLRSIARDLGVSPSLLVKRSKAR